MGQDTKATDWEFASIFSASGAGLATAGVWFFTFRSKMAAYARDYALIAGGGSLSIPSASFDLSMQDTNTGELAWSTIPCDRPFSGADLEGAAATFTNYGVSLGAGGYSVLQLSVSAGNKYLFRNAENAGYSISFGLEVMKAMGTAAKLASAGMKSMEKIDQLLVKAGGQVIAGKLLGFGSGTGIMAKNIAKLISAGVRFQSGIATGGAALAKVEVAIAFYPVTCLYMFGQNLLEGRGAAISYAYANGYAWAMADVTCSPNWVEIDDTLYKKYLRLNVKTILDNRSRDYLNMGSSAPLKTLADIEEAGRAAAVQQAEAYWDSKGEAAAEAAFKSQRDLYGADRIHRRSKYIDRLYRQIKAGASAGGGGNIKLGVEL